MTSPAVARKPRKCQYCGGEYHSAHPSKMFCTPKCKTDFGNYMASRGKVLMPIALAWRTLRGKKGTGSEALAEMVQFLDKCAAELTAQGAQPMGRHFEKVRAGGNGSTTWRDCDRPRPSRAK